MKYVINMLAIPKTVTTSQMKGLNASEAMDSYLKNSIICLSSFRINNPTFQPILFTSFDLDVYWNTRLEEEKIKNIFVPFGEFGINDKFSWSIVQYRYDVLNYLVNNFNDDDVIVQLDTDVICTGNLDEMVKELESFDNAMMLFDVQHTCDIRDRKNILDNYEKLYGKREYFTHYGGEFIGGKISQIKKLLDYSKQIIEDSKKSNDLVNFNDEHITSIAVHIGNIKIYNANAYLFRYWTHRFYLVSTNYKFNKVMLWHLPGEKNIGMQYVYNYYIKKRSLPSSERMASCFGFAAAKQRMTPLRTGVLYKYRFKKLFKIIKTKLKK